MLTPELQEELIHLCWEYQYGTLSPKAAARLEKLVLNHDGARDIFIQYSGMCANLEWEGIVDPGPLGRSTAYDPLSSTELRTLPDYLSATRSTPARWKVMSAILAFTLLIISSALLLYFQFWLDHPPRFLVRVINTQHAIWEDGKRHWSHEDLLHAGDQLHLSSGVVELETISGAHLILKGTSRLIPIEPDRFKLDLGNLFANVPPQSQGLTVETATSRIVDLGTRFGLIVNPSQETEVHVLKGLVEFNLVNADREVTVTRNLTEKTAIRVQPHSRHIEKIESTPECFVQNLNDKAPELVTHWKLSDQESSRIARDSGDHRLNLKIIEAKGKSPFRGQQAPQNTTTAAGPFDSQLYKLYRRLSAAEAGLFHMDRFTIELWARNPNNDRQGDSDTLFHYRNVEQHTTSQFNLFANDHSGRLGFGFLTTNGKYVSHLLDKATKWQKDCWYHIVFTYDANTSASHDSIVTYTRTPEYASEPDIQQTFTKIEDIAPLVPGGILAIGGSTLTDISRHWGGDIADVRFINGIPDRHANIHLKSRQGIHN
ncbi:LamG-like jellyroll fold domain-containing protein [uncultured Gimesia sp.]|uniref:LamG-like jellyroll fold domain-containing protein n=1 Tax=uncultured Gimesia sp. TaxID=1678688 RepID=UPI0030DDAB24|tara:strand:+ start:57350 stop:58978 length:1629 start_codon:yes stop_codon:yes gene_type:complete